MFHPYHPTRQPEGQPGFRKTQFQRNNHREPSLAQRARATSTREYQHTTIGHSNVPNLEKIHITVLIEGFPCSMAVDTGSSLTIVSWNTIKKAVPELEKKQLEPQKLVLKDY